MTNKDYWTLKAMTKYGGSFVKGLAQLAHTADPTNLNKIKHTWVDYWAEYEIMGEKLEKENEKELKDL